MPSLVKCCSLGGARRRQRYGTSSTIFVSRALAGTLRTRGRACPVGSNSTAIMCMACTLPHHPLSCDTLRSLIVLTPCMSADCVSAATIGGRHTTLVSHQTTMGRCRGQTRRGTHRAERRHFCLARQPPSFRLHTTMRLWPRVHASRASPGGPTARLMAPPALTTI